MSFSPIVGRAATANNSPTWVFLIMITFETAANFLLLNMSICLIPCVEMVIVITQSSIQGWRHGIAFVTGTCTALVVQVAVMAVGLSAIIQTSALLFNALKIVGVGYLFFLAWQKSKI